jgi:hypothetical protein
MKLMLDDSKTLGRVKNKNIFLAVNTSLLAEASPGNNLCNLLLERDASSVIYSEVVAILT